MADMHTPLSPCPFCGSSDAINPRDHIVSLNNFTTGEYCSFGCDICGAQVGQFATRELAAAAWNRRSPSQDAETIKALEAQIATKDAALRDADYALSNLVDGFEFDDNDPDGPCQAEELCGNRMCEECGCLKDKRDAARAALAGSAS